MTELLIDPNSGVTFFKKQLFEPRFWLQSFYSAFTGSIAVNFISSGWLDKLLPVIILGGALYSLLNRMQEINNHQLPEKNRLLQIKQQTQGLILGFYDGISGPGTSVF